MSSSAMTGILHETQYGLIKYHILIFKAELMSDMRQNGEKGSCFPGGMWADKEVMTLLAKNSYVFLFAIRSLKSF